MADNTILCRFAPSPTGPLHVGGVRSALFNYFFARQNRGRLILRIEDTGRERSKPEYEKDIMDAFDWLGLEFDETHRQSDRAPIYRDYLKRLIEKGHAYISKESDVKDGGRTEVIRFKNPNRRVVFQDLVKGEIAFDTTELGDFVIAKTLDEPLFHLAVVVDDFEMGITHVIRGEDHISNTPRQMLIQEAIGAPRPAYAHIPLILSADRSKLSKRKHGDKVSLKFYREQGYLPATMINYLALLGWNPGDERELFSKAELVKEFRIDRIQKGGAIFSEEKLRWMNREYLNQLPAPDIIHQIVRNVGKLEPLIALQSWQLERVAAMLRERIHTFGDAQAIARSGELDYLARRPVYDRGELLWSKKPDVNLTKTHLGQVVNILHDCDERLHGDEARAVIYPYAAEVGRGEVLWPLRFALSGLERSADPFTIISILGKTESIARTNNALSLLE